MNHQNILISFNICCYNSQKYIKETINSIIDQTYKNWEIIIIDDGSTDDTSNIIKNYIKKGVKLKYFYQKNKGFAYSRNFAIKQSSGEWIAILDHDDICNKNRLEVQVKNIINNPKCNLFFSNIEMFSDNSIPVNKFNKHLEKDGFNIKELNLSAVNARNNLIEHGCFITTSSVIFNKNIIGDDIKFDDKYIFISDYIFFLNTSYKYNIFYENTILVKWRKHEDQVTTKKEKILIKELSSLYFSFYFSNLSIFIKFRIMYKHIRILVKYIKLILLHKLKND
tara:strand:+ start:124 stop:966 length:843 start_codon:yes stop_codon:yes gene_type:complete